MKALIDKLKQSGFRFNEWARDTLMREFPQVLAENGVEAEDPKA
jgi:hypothetical protein